MRQPTPVRTGPTENKPLPRHLGPTAQAPRRAPFLDLPIGAFEVIHDYPRQGLLLLLSQCSTHAAGEVRASATESASGIALHGDHSEAQRGTARHSELNVQGFNTQKTKYS
jgi:hypothetical protein